MTVTSSIGIGIAICLTRERREEGGREGERGPIFLIMINYVSDHVDCVVVIIYIEMSRTITSVSGE